MLRLEWCADPVNRYADGQLKDMPEEVVNAGTVIDERLEQLGTLLNLVERDDAGNAILHEEPDGYSHITSTPFVRSPLRVKVPRRLHLEGAKRRLLPNGQSVPYSVDMTAPRPVWWTEREERRAVLRQKRAARPATARVGRSGGGKS
jgi:hypothetical protein